MTDCRPCLRLLLQAGSLLSAAAGSGAPGRGGHPGSPGPAQVYPARRVPRCGLPGGRVGGFPGGGVGGCRVGGWRVAGLQACRHAGMPACRHACNPATRHPPTRHPPTPPPGNPPTRPPGNPHRGTRRAGYTWAGPGLPGCPPRPGAPDPAAADRSEPACSRRRRQGLQSVMPHPHTYARPSHPMPPADCGALASNKQTTSKQDNCDGKRTGKEATMRGGTHTG